MLDFYVSSEQSILELYTDQLDDYIRIYNSQADPADTIYLILPFLENNQTLYWQSTTSLTGPALDLIVLTQNNLVIENVDFRHFLSILVSDNIFHRDGNKFLVIQNDEYKNHSIRLKNCQAINAHFACDNLEWFGGRVKENLFAELHGSNTKLTIEGIDTAKVVIGTLIIAENAKPSSVSLRNVAIINNFSCEGVETLFLQDVKTGRGTCKLIAHEIEGLSNFQNLSDELIIKAEIASISSFISPIGKVYIDVHTFIEFKADGDGRFQGMDLNIDVSRAIEKKIALPFGYIKFDRISIKGASLIDIPGSVIAEQMEILNSLQVSLNESRIGHLKYQTPIGKIFFGKHSAKSTKIDSLWLIGNIEANFQGASEVFDLDSDGRCHISILDNYQGKIIKLNLNLNAKQDNIESNKDGYFGFHVHNNGDKKVEIETILAKLNSFNISGSVKLGQVLCRPIDKQYNLIQINVKHLRQISIDGFFVGYDHNIVIDTSTGKISLVQTLDRALASSQMVVDNNATIEASQIFVSEEVITQVGGNLTIKDGYNIHIHDYHAKKYSVVSFNKGSVKSHTTKNIHNFHEKGEAIPTLVCAGGIFYGIVEGKMHVLGSTIMAKDIHLAVPNGLKLEVSKYTDKSLIFVSENGSKFGYYNKGNQEGGVKIGAYTDKDDLKLWETHLNPSSLIASNSLSIIVKDGTFEQISSEIAAKIIQVEARNWVAKTYDEQIISKHVKQHVEVGVKLAGKQTVTAAIDKIKMLVNKKGSHILDNLDRVFKAYDAYKSLALLPETAASGGLYAYLEASRSQELTNTSIAVDNTINGETIIARIGEDINFAGVRMTAHDVDIEAVNFNFETSSDKFDYEYDFGEISIDIDLMNEGLLTTASAGAKSVESHSVTHHKNYIKAGGNLKVTLSGDGKFKGVSLEGTNVAIKANNLILESVQDTISEKLKGANIHVGLQQEYGITGFGGGVENGYNKAAWTNQIASIIGKQIVNITVKETLEIAGGLIANAEEDKNGNLTDKGNLSVNCGRLIVKTIHDYDEGVTLGVGVSFQVKASETKGKEGEKEVTFDHAPLKVQLKDKRREISATIGQGAIAVGEITGDPLNRNITAQTKVTHNEEGSFDSVIHADMFDRLSGNLPKRPVSVKKVDTEAVRSDLNPDPNLIKRTGYYVSDIAENFKDAIKDLATSAAQSANFLGAEVDVSKLNARMYKLFGGEQYMQEFGSKLGLSSQQYETLIDKNLLERLTNNEFSTENKESVQELNNEVGIDALQKFLEDKIDLNAENKASLQALLHILKARYVKAAANAKAEGKSGVDFNQFVESLNNELFSKNPEFTARVGKDFAEGINIGKQIVIAYVYKIEAEKVKAEQEKEAQQQKEQKAREAATEAKQIKAKQQKEQEQQQKEIFEENALQEIEQSLGKLPNNMNYTEVAELNSIKQSFEEKYEDNLPKETKEKLSIITYNLSKELAQKPELIETKLACALPLMPPPLVGISGEPMSYSDIGAGLLSRDTPKSYSENLVERAFLGSNIWGLLIIADKLGLLNKLTGITVTYESENDYLEVNKNPPKQKPQTTSKTANISPDPEEDDPFARFKKKENADFYECEQSESPVWKELRFYRKIEGKATKTNGLTGRNLRYYQWDNLHKEIEMYDSKGKPLDALDPVTGKAKIKNVAGHRPLKLN